MNHGASSRMAAILTVAAVALVSSCSRSSSAAPCTGAVRGQGEKAIVLLADGRSPALSAATEALAAHPAEVFSSAQLGFVPARSGTASTPGVVVLATYDDRGNVTTRGAFNLAGTGNDDQVRELSRRHQASCLTEAVDALPTPSDSAGDLLRTLERASATAVAQSGAGRAVVVAVGLGRSTIDGQPIAGLDLSPAGQELVFAELDRVGLVPDLASAGAAVRFLDPSEGVASSVSAEGVKSFATSLCERMGGPCTTGPALG